MSIGFPSSIGVSPFAAPGVSPVGGLGFATQSAAPVSSLNGMAFGSPFGGAVLQASSPSEAAFNQQLANFDAQFGGLFQLGASMSPVAQNLMQQYQVALVQEAQQQQAAAIAQQQAIIQMQQMQQQQAIQQAQAAAMLQDLFGQLQGAIGSLAAAPAADATAAPAADPAAAPAADATAPPTA